MICHFLCKKGRVGRELFEFEELWFSFSRTHFVFSHPNSFSPPWGKSKPLGSKCDLETKDMSAHLTLSGGREKHAVAETFNRTWHFFPRQVAEGKRKWLLHNQSCHMSEFFTDVVAWFLYFKFCDSIGEQWCFQTESLVRAIRQRDLRFLFEVLYLILTIAFIFVI